TVHQTDSTRSTTTAHSTTIRTFVLPGAVTTIPGAVVTEAGVVTTLPPVLITGPPRTITATALSAADAQLVADNSGIWGSRGLYIGLMVVLGAGVAYGLYRTLRPVNRGH
ncbi:MAG: hypothetical protein ACHQNA_08900, partial [Acidimicrobiales bacterium]